MSHFIAGVQTEVWRKRGLGAFSTEQRLEVWGKMRVEGAVIVRILMNHNRMDPGSPLSVSFLSTYVSILSCYQTSNSFIWLFDALLSSMLLHFRGVGSLLHYSSLSPYFTTSELHLQLPPTTSLSQDFPDYTVMQENPIGPGQWFSFSRPHNRLLNGQWFDCILVRWPVPSNQ